jgi:predicted HicB family RNase H-like nuclease
MQAMTLRLPDEVHEALRREAFESRRSMNAVVIEALDEYWWNVLQRALREGTR